MPKDVPIQVIRISELNVLASFLPHRHSFYMLLWTTKGEGRHRVNFREFTLSPGLLFYMHEGQVHQVIKYPEDGWIVLFRQSLFLEYLQQNPTEEQSGFFDFFNRSPFVVLEKSGKELFEVLMPALQADAKTTPFHRCVSLKLGLLLCHANRLSGPVMIEDPLSRELIRKLKVMVNEHFRTKRSAPFYSSKLGISTRKLNALTERCLGKLVNELITERLLSEAEALLGGTTMLMKEIIIELAFADHSHFTVFFRKEKGMTPTEFRRKMHDLQKDHTS